MRFWGFWKPSETLLLKVTTSWRSDATRRDKTKQVSSQNVFKTRPKSWSHLERKFETRLHETFGIVSSCLEFLDGLEYFSRMFFFTQSCLIRNLQLRRYYATNGATCSTAPLLAQHCKLWWRGTGGTWRWWRHSVQICSFLAVLAQIWEQVLVTSIVEVMYVSMMAEYWHPILVQQYEEPIPSMKCRYSLTIGHGRLWVFTGFWMSVGGFGYFRASWMFTGISMSDYQFLGVYRYRKKSMGVYGCLWL